MDLAIGAAAFAVIFVSELPDKSMFAALILATHGKPAAVWLGAASAFLVHVVIATTVGVALFAFLPQRVVDGLVALLFLVGGLYALRASAKDREEEAIIETTTAKPRPVAITAFLVVFLAEWGDLTQILTANLAARYHDPLSVGTGATLALWSVAALAVVGGQGLLRFVDVTTIRRVTAAVLLVLAGTVAFSAIQ